MALEMRVIRMRVAEMRLRAGVGIDAGGQRSEASVRGRGGFLC